MIAIKDLEMPKSCDDCPFYEYRNDEADRCWIKHTDIQGVEFLDKRHPKCPLVEIPKEHGRLIDEKEAMGLIAEGKDDKAYFGTVNKDWEVIDFLKTVPTIIEADKEA